MAITKKILAKAKARPSAATASTKKVSKPLPDESSDSESDAQDLQDQESAEEESGDSENEEEEDDVTEEALQRMMELLGDVDPEELALLEAEAAAESGSEGEEGQDQDDDEDEDDEDMYNLEDGSDAEEEGMYEDLQEEDTDITPVERTTVNDKVALARVLASFKTETTFFDTLSLTYPHALDIPDAENDLERELQFYKQSLWAVQHAEGLFAAASLPFTRPDDYFAEMLKTDAHMSLIRQSLLNESAGIKASEDARKLRDAKKFGKKVQVERLKEREKEKKEVGKRLESLKKKRKAGDGGFASTEDFDIALEDAISGPAKRVKTNESERGGRGGRGGARGGGTARGISRRGRDSKFGNPTTSRRPKENNDKMDGEGSGFSRGRGRGGSRGGRGGGRGGGDRGGSRGASKQRLGKSRRN